MDAESAKSGDPAVTLFFEIPLPEGLRDQTLKYAVFHDLFKAQLNLLHLRDSSHQVELKFTKDQASGSLAVPN